MASEGPGCYGPPRSAAKAARQSLQSSGSDELARFNSLYMVTVRAKGSVTAAAQPDYRRQTKVSKSDSFSRRYSSRFARRA